MSRVIGVDLRKGTVRLAVVKSGFRALEVEAFAEAERAQYATLPEALSAALRALGEKAARIDTVAATIPGGQSFLLPLKFPKSAERRIGELVPFELEAELPVDLDELTFGYQQLASDTASTGTLSYLVAAARVEHVQSVIRAVQEGLGHEPEKLGVSSLELAGLVQLWPGIGAGEPAAFVDVGEETTDICVVEAGNARGARTLNLGYLALPGRAELFAAQVRQTLSGHAVQAGERAIESIVLLGEGARTPGIVELLSSALEVRVLVLESESATPAGLVGLSAEDRARVPEFGRALGAALQGAKGKGFDLRRGELAYSRGYGYLKERAPLLFALGVTIFLSFLFATWAEGRALARDQEILAQSLKDITKATFGEATDSPEEARSMMQRFVKANPEDPMPYMDGFGAAVALSKAVPNEIVHDVELLEYTKGKLKLRGLVGSTEDAQRVAKGLEDDECIHDAKVTKITQVVNSDRARYLLEAEIRCPLDRQPEEAKKKSTGGAQ